MASKHFFLFSPRLLVTLFPAKVELAKLELFIDFPPCVFQPHGPIEYHLLWCGVRVYIEVADTLELQISKWFHAGGIFLDVAVGQYVQ